jgi:hypothetical protein
MYRGRNEGQWRGPFIYLFIIYLFFFAGGVGMTLHTRNKLIWLLASISSFMLSLKNFFTQSIYMAQLFWALFVGHERRPTWAAVCLIWIHNCWKQLHQTHDVPSSSLSLRSASMITFGSKQGFVSCHRKRYCIDKKCKCLSKNMKCNSKCHSNSSCKNKWASPLFFISLRYMYFNR